MSECHIGMNYSIHHLAENRQTWPFSEMEHDARLCQTCSPTHYAHFVFKTATQQFCTGCGGADGFGNLDNWVSQELQHFGPFIGQRGENVHLLFGRVAFSVCSTPVIIRICSLCSQGRSKRRRGLPCWENVWRIHHSTQQVEAATVVVDTWYHHNIYTLYIIPCRFWEVRNTASAAPVRHLPIRQDQEEPENDRGLRFSPVVRFRFFYSLLKELARLKVELSATGGQAMQHRCEA